MVGLSWLEWNKPDCMALSVNGTKAMFHMAANTFRKRSGLTNKIICLWTYTKEKNQERPSGAAR